MDETQNPTNPGEGEEAPVMVPDAPAAAPEITTNEPAEEGEAIA